ncbi:MULTISPECIES: enoyl-CoA hydratase-related protein [unclassified Pseudovibrio]|uniref:enoyl-CoA hydratase-related protein n=1 Tax=unclassified Pseudovibrio TaxID=2627060 RepID=UPI0007AED103|nr:MULTISPECIES: enoyl-CoA hydratase-related protein [unclassified Pseudovibrio]KZK98189.1 putative enoyl-CoA hydratase echA8 [Pseudovibrio sp. W74]KZL04143.1 putative enoyl-CoA hydratase echA8 [Pseudovibrio sp. Ad14]KZL12967.1 putative enoyl-CoA hydratase echA8 [Pseudovibrio sp. Ad37]
MTYQNLRIEKADNGITTLLLARAEKHNAMNAEMMDELIAAAEELDNCEQTRAIILAADGETFCAGGDLKWMQAQAEKDRIGKMQEANRLAGMLKRLDSMKKPLIARVHGPAYGGGVGILSVCDLVVAADNTKFALTETRLGLIPATIGTYVVRRLGEGHARQVFMNARPFGAQRAHHLGLVSLVTTPEDLHAVTQKEAEAYLNCAPGAVADAKALCQNLARMPAEDQIDYTANALADRWETTEAQAGISAFFAKETPPWRK